MGGTFIERLRDEAGLTGRALATKAGINSGQLTKIEQGQHGLSEQMAVKLGGALGVDPMALMLSHGFSVMHEQAEKGAISPREVATKGAQLLQLAHETPGLLTQSEFNRFVKLGQGIHELAEKAASRAATKSRADGDTMSLLGRDGLGRTSSKSTGVRSAFANSTPVDGPTGYIGGGRPETESISHPSVRALADAVLSLEADIEDGTISGHGILAAVANVLNSFEQEALAADAKAAGPWLARLKKLANSAAGNIGTSEAGSTKGRGREPGDHRGVGGVSLKKRYGA